MLLQALRGLQKKRQRLQVRRSPGCRFGLQPGLRKLRQQRFGRAFFLRGIEDQRVVGRSQRDHVLRSKARSRDPHSVDERAVPAARIAQKIAVGVAVDQGVRARNLGARDAQVAVRTPPQRERKMVHDN